jgi:hypothetical protein
LDNDNNNNEKLAQRRFEQRMTMEMMFVCFVDFLNTRQMSSSEFEPLTKLGRENNVAKIDIVQEHSVNQRGDEREQLELTVREVHRPHRRRRNRMESTAQRTCPS